MAILTVTHGEIDADRLSRVFRANEAFGFPRWHQHAVGDWTVTIHGPLQDVGPQLVKSDGKVTGVAGTVFYRDKAGESALRQLETDLWGDGIDPMALIGHAAIVSASSDEIRLTADALGNFKLFHDPDQRVFSTSFAVVADLAASKSLDHQGAYEYAWLQIAHGTRTFLNEVRVLPVNQLVSFAAEQAPKVTQLAQIDWKQPDFTSLKTMQPALDDATHRLDRVFGLLVDQYGDDLNSSISGGFDSRLILAGLIAKGSRPRLWVYGEAEDKDCVIAEILAKAKGLTVTRTDKTQAERPAIDALPSEVEANYFAFDGWRPSGLFDLGVDRRDRQDRLQGFGAFLNGSGGEIYRNFFYLKNRSFTADEMLSIFYTAYDPDACTDAFDETVFRRRLASRMAAEVGSDADTPLGRQDIELLYPLFRVRYWSARDVALNARFGGAVFPFMIPYIIAGTATLPLGWKNLGRFEAELINRFDPELASLPTGYGFRFNQPPSWRYRLSMASTMIRPPQLRRLSYRLRRRNRAGTAPAWLDKTALGQVINPDFPALSGLFKIKQIADPNVLNRIATMEYILAR